MARSREPVKPVEPQSDSGEEDDEGSSEEEYDSEPEQMQTQAATPKKQVAPSPQPPASSGEEESESESESEKPQSPVKPLAVLQKPTASEGKKTRSKPKRPAEDDATPRKSAKKKKVAEAEKAEITSEKKEKAEITSDKKSTPFQRLWSGEDEIGILEAMLEYSSKKKADPMANLNAFYEYTKKKLHSDFDFSKLQLQDKIRRLKKKFVNNNKKEVVGKEKTFSNPVEQKGYNLSKLIWGVGNVVSKKTPKRSGNVNVKAAHTDSEEDNRVKVARIGEGSKSTALLRRNLNTCLSMEENMLEAGRVLLEGETDWSKLRVEELKLYMMQLEIRLQQTKLVLDVMKQQ